jgi:hypothetical protein
LEEFRNVIMASIGGKARPSSVMVLEDGQEGRFIADACDVQVVEVVQAIDKRFRPSECAYEFGLIVRYKERILPNT